MTTTPPEQPEQPVATPNPYAPEQVAAPTPYSMQHYPGGVVYAPAPPRGLSIAAMVLGIVGLVGFAVGGGLLSIGAVIFGHIGIRKEPAGRGMAIAGLVTGYAGVGLSVILIAFVVILPLIIFAIAGTVAVGTAGISS